MGANNSSCQERCSCSSHQPTSHSSQPTEPTPPPHPDGPKYNHLPAWYSLENKSALHPNLSNMSPAIIEWMFSIHEPRAIRVARAHDAIPDLYKLRDYINSDMATVRRYAGNETPYLPPYELEAVKKRNTDHQLKQWMNSMRRIRKYSWELQEKVNALNSDVRNFKDWVQGWWGDHFTYWLCPRHEGKRVPTEYTAPLAFGLEEAVPKLIAELDALLPLHQDFLDDIPDEYWQEVPNTYRTEGSAYK